MSEGNTHKTQLVVIGAGPGGYAAAFSAADKGMEVTIVDAGSTLGGVCLNRGCIPSKALLHVAELIRETGTAKKFGLKFDPPDIDVDGVRDFKNDVVGKLTSGLDQLAKARKVKVIRAWGKFASSTRLDIERNENSADDIPAAVEFEHAIVATGSLPAIPGPFRIDDPRIMNSREALDLPEIPKKLLVIGGGYIGLEMGMIYSALGSKVTVVELLDGILPGADRDLVKPLQKHLEKDFESINVSTKVESLKPKKNGVEVELSSSEGKSKKTFDGVLISVGRIPNTKNLGLENTSVQLDEQGFVIANERQETDDQHIMAIGDAAGQPMLAHKASREGKVAAEVLAGEPAAFDNVAIPAVVFTDPEIAWCGLTETEAKEKGIEIEVAKFSWAASGRAISLGRPQGFTKLLFDPKTEILRGVAMVGARAGELISEGVLAIEMGAVARDIADSIHPHPTLTETTMEAAEIFLGSSTHSFRPKKK